MSHTIRLTEEQYLHLTTALRSHLQERVACASMAETMPDGADAAFEVWVGQIQRVLQVLAVVEPPAEGRFLVIRLRAQLERKAPRALARLEEEGLL